MPRYLVVHLGAYDASQLEEEQGCPAIACIVNMKSQGEAAKEGAKKFRSYGRGPVGRVVATPAGSLTEEVLDY